MHTLMQTIQHHRTRYALEPASDGMRIYISLLDARCLDELGRRQGDLMPVSEMQDGDTGTAYGIPFTVDAALPPGQAYMGYRVATPSIQEEQRA